MEVAIALLSISPQELEALRWTFADRKRLLDHLLASGRAAQGVDTARLGMLPIEISIPRDDLTKMQQFAVRELPKARSEERRVGKECVGTCRFRWSPIY